MQAKLNPATASERIEFLDALRGIALLGIILANMISYSLYLYLSDTQIESLNPLAIDKYLDFLELTLIEGKFYTIFSILFGIGFAIILERSIAKKLKFARFFLWRMALLAGIGIVHAMFFWHNDILFVYACCGMLLIPVARLSNKSLSALALMMLIIPLIFKMTTGEITPVFSQLRDYFFAQYGFTPDTMVETWQSASPGRIYLLNFSMWFGQLDYVIGGGMIFKIFGCFLIGYLIGRNKLYEQMQGFRRVIGALAIAGISAGLVLNVIYAMHFYTDSWKLIVSETFAILPLSIGYIALAALLWQGTGSRNVMRIFVPVGRLALTSYFMQSVLCTLLFYNTGFGLGGKFTPSGYLLTGLIVFALQVFFSRIWLSYFRFGPLEWIWRSLTYGRQMSMLKPARLPQTNAL